MTTTYWLPTGRIPFSGTTLPGHGRLVLVSIQLLMLS